MRMRAEGFAVTALLCLLSLFAGARGEVVWLESEYDFGTFREELGSVHGEARMVNLGPDSTYIRRVKATCGCTNTGYTRMMLAPGDTARVWFDYDARRRPGPFEKHIKVYYGADNTLKSITIKGTVIGTSETLLPSYPVEAAPLRLQTSLFDGRTAKLGSTDHVFLSGYNQSADSVAISFASVPEALDVSVSRPVVAPGDIFTAGIYFNSRSGGVQPGRNSYVFDLLADGRPVAAVGYVVDVEADYSALTPEQMRQAPVCRLKPVTIDLGTLRRGAKPKKISAEFTVANEGASELRIERIYSPDHQQALKVERMPLRIRPGKSGKVKLQIVPGELPDGVFRLDISVISNDPLHPVSQTKVVGIMEN